MDDAFKIIPNEILCIIFELTCAKNLLQEYPWPIYSVHKPTSRLIFPAIIYLPALAISAVCTRWRFLALASPRLWSQMRLEPSPDETSMGGQFLSTLQLYLDRSADAPLMIDVETKGCVQIKCNSPALNLLLNHTHRWKSFSYTGDYNLERWIDFSGSFSILEDLVLVGYSRSITKTDFQCFKDAPNLRAFSTTGTLISDLPWKRLSSLSLRINASEENSIALLQQHLDLTVLKLHCLWFPSVIIAPLPKLESFTFVECTSYSDRLLKKMFTSFTFPSLKELVICSKFTMFNLWSSDAFSAFISRSNCVLTTLSLRAVIISDLDLIAALRLLPSLVRFTVDKLMNTEGTGGPITSHFIVCMHSSSTLPLLPRLHTLSVTDYGASFDDLAFVDMVSSRWLPGSLAATVGIDCLRSLVLHLVDRDVDKNVYKPLWHLDRMGMQVVVSGEYGFLACD